MDIGIVRNDIEGIDEHIYFNSASSSLRIQQSSNVMINYLLEEAKNGGYETARKYKDQLNAFYTEAAKLINANVEEIALVENASVGWCNAFFSIPFNSGDIILTTENEYASNFINYLKVNKEKGVEIKIIPSTKTGEVNLEVLKTYISPKVKLIAVTHIPTNGGLVNPAEEIGILAAENNILYLLDACQSAGQYPLDVKKIHCDFLTATGRKYLRGPRGTGFLYAKKSTIQKVNPNALDLHSAVWTEKNDFTIASNASRFETWENNKIAQLGLAEAIKYANNLGINNIWERVEMLGNYLRNTLHKINGIEVHDRGKVKCGIVTFTATGVDPSLLQQKLFNKKVSTNVSFKGSTLIDMEKRKLPAVIRASLHYYNTIEEIEAFALILDATVKEIV